MTVFIAHAPQDAPVAQALETFLERRGLFVERETGEKGFRFVQPRDAVVVLWSREAFFTPYRLQTEKRALDAWADEQLILVRTDHHVLPVGLRDLASIDAAFEPQREIAWSAVAKAAQDLQLGRRAEAEEKERRSDADPMRRRVAPPAPQAPAPQVPSAPGAGQAPGDAEAPAGGGVFTWAGVLAAVVTMLAIALGAMAPLAFGLHDTIVPLVTAAAFVFAVWRIMKDPDWASGLWRRITGGGQPDQSAKPAPPPAMEAPPAEPAAGAAFVSYAHADAGAVLPVVDQVVASGKPVWIDRAGIQAGDGWAGEIVRAIKAAGGVVVMCSAKAFQSDHVRRELYLADRYKKPMLPVFIEEAAPPEEFEYFFAGVQWLKLFEAPENERAAALARVWPAP